MGKDGPVMRLSHLASHGGERGACDETEPVGWSRWVRRGPEPVGWSRWVRVMRLSQLVGHGGLPQIYISQNKSPFKYPSGHDIRS